MGHRLPRPTPGRGHRRPRHLQRPHHRNRHHVLPTTHQQNHHPSQTRQLNRGGAKIRDDPGAKSLDETQAVAAGQAPAPNAPPAANLPLPDAIVPANIPMPDNPNQDTQALINGANGAPPLTPDNSVVVAGPPDAAAGSNQLQGGTGGDPIAQPPAGTPAGTQAAQPAAQPSEF